MISKPREQGLGSRELSSPVSKGLAIKIKVLAWYQHQDEDPILWQDYGNDTHVLRVQLKETEFCCLCYAAVPKSLTLWSGQLASVNLAAAWMMDD